MACSWTKQPIWQGGYLNAVNDAVIGGQLTTVPSGVPASQFEQTLPGDHLTLDEAAAGIASSPTIGTLHGGYFQYVQLDATALDATAISSTITITAAGSGYAQATTTVTFTAPSSGITATGVPVISSTGTLVAIIVTNQGHGYSSAPTITVAGAGSSATATAALQTVPTAIALGQAVFWKNSGVPGTTYTVSPVEGGNAPLFAGVILNPNWTPGNYSWIQVLGRATVLSSGSITALGGVQLAVTGTASTLATFTVGSGSASATLIPYFVGVSEQLISSGNTGIVDIQKVTLRF